jgi:diguanylate cyclase (GGDEF)-like protein
MVSVSRVVAKTVRPARWGSLVGFVALLGVAAAASAWPPRPRAVAVPAPWTEGVVCGATTGGADRSPDSGDLLTGTALRWAPILLTLGGGAILLARSREIAREAARQLERQVLDRTEELRQANERLAALAMTDELTGVANRRRLMSGLQESMAFARRHDTQLSILLADLDGFKQVNDRLGHALGDEVLRWAAHAIAQELRTEDLVGRYGGDEFIVILPGTDLASARIAGERLRRAVLGLDDRLSALGLPGALTVSVGVTAFVGDVTQALELVERADQAAYRAKTGGKNQVSD